MDQNDQEPHQVEYGYLKVHLVTLQQVFNWQ